MRTTRVSRVGSLLLAVMVALGLAACGGGGSKADAGANFVGVWELSSVEGDSEFDDSDITMMKELGTLWAAVWISDSGLMGFLMLPVLTVGNCSGRRWGIDN